ncbi:unnamed protein product [Polarella glacialis]|uniref:guanylate cyclase n=1 Tax=Polarella glacialis TaxID=89957 RepID=A0A813D8U2_POLGL|nr:unnamed protein product [Polarella glacialis]
MPTMAQQARTGTPLVAVVPLVLVCLLRGSMTFAEEDDLSLRGSRKTSANRSVFSVGVLAHRGKARAYMDWNLTFDEFLSAEVGSQFDPPLKFRMQALDYAMLDLAWKSGGGTDFVVADPSLCACMEAEQSARVLLTLRSSEQVGANTSDRVELSQYAGIIFALTNRTDLQHIEDIEGRSVAAVSISSLGSGQMQFMEMTKRGMHFLQSPAQLVFAGSQDIIVQGVMNGKWDFGFVRTGEIPLMRSKGFGWDKFKMIDPVGDPDSDGSNFRLPRSTDLYPEWCLSVLPGIPEAVAAAVQSTLLHMAHDSVLTKASGTAGWRTSLSYLPLQGLRQELGLQHLNLSTGRAVCQRGSTLYDLLSCPPGYTKKSRQDVTAGCATASLECEAQHQCLFKPCAKLDDCAEPWKTQGPDQPCLCGGVKVGSSSCVGFFAFFANVALGSLGLGLLASLWMHSRRRKPWQINLADLAFDDPLQLLGRSGCFGQVVKARYNGVDVAVQYAVPPRVSSKGKTSFERSVPAEHTLTSSGIRRMISDVQSEMYRLYPLRHTCLTILHGAVISGTSSALLVSELMHYGSLYELLHSSMTLLDGDMMLLMLRDIAQGLCFLHSSQPVVVHGELSSNMILVDRNFNAKLFDFGFSQKLTPCGPCSPKLWWSPERLSGGCCAQEADVFAFGIVVNEVITRKDPYHDQDLDEVLLAVSRPDLNRRPVIPDWCPHFCQQLMQDCWLSDSSLRPFARELECRLHTAETRDVEQPQTGGSQTPTYQRSKVERMRNWANLIYDIFPPHMADVLTRGEKIEPEHKALVTIFFSDIIGFTEIASGLEPIQISSMLDNLYSEFDLLSRKMNVFKVETIGDAYMAVTNLHAEQSEDHAKRIIEFALAAIKVANSTPIDVADPSKGFINIRVGVHSGPVVANVVGSRNLRYCLFGDTVNVAARMESTSMRNQIHLSARTAELVALQALGIQLEPRGPVEIKGKGMMETYWVQQPPAGVARVQTLD